MGGVEGRKGAWGYVSGGMGALSGALARAATTFGAEIFTDKVSRFIKSWSECQKFLLESRQWQRTIEQEVANAHGVLFEPQDKTQILKLWFLYGGDSLKSGSLLPPVKLAVFTNHVRTHIYLLITFFFTPQAVSQILLSSDKKVQGVCLQDGTEVKSRLVLSNASPRHTFLELTPQVCLAFRQNREEGLRKIC